MFMNCLPDSAGLLRREERFVPFGVGKRVCLGESLARDEVNLTLCCNIYYTDFCSYSSSSLGCCRDLGYRLWIALNDTGLCRFEACEGYPQPSPDPVAGFILAPKPFYARAVPRE